MTSKDRKSGINHSVQYAPKRFNQIEMDSKESLALDLQAAEERIAAAARNQILRTKIRIINQHFFTRMFTASASKENSLKIPNDASSQKNTLNFNSCDEKKSSLGISSENSIASSNKDQSSILLNANSKSKNSESMTCYKECTQKMNEQLEKSRERNRIHSRSTRKRKKERLQSLECDVECLRKEQISLRQAINYENTGGVCRNNFGVKLRRMEPEVDELLNRSVEDIPSVSSKKKMLPGLILSRQERKTCQISENVIYGAVDSKINNLLFKDPLLCTAEEIKEIRRQRNRLHAKHTRAKKKIHTKEMKSTKTQLERENHKLREHLEMLRNQNDPNLPISAITTSRISTLVDEHGL